MKERAIIGSRILTFLLVLALVLGTAVALSGCQSKEQQAEASLKSLLDDYKSGTLDLLNDSESSELAGMDVNTKELLSALTEDFSYEINGATENTGTGTVDVKVTIHSKQLVSAIKNALPDMLSYSLSASTAGASEEEIQAQLSSMVIEQLKHEDAVDTTITVPMQEDSGDVITTAEGKQALVNAILGDVDELQKALTIDASELKDAA